MRAGILFAACSATAQSRAQLGFAVAVCAFELATEAVDAAGLPMIQLMPAGEFVARDGRPATVSKGRVLRWRLDDAAAATVVARVNGRATPVPIDYEHQMLNALENGQPAPASGYIRRVEWRPGIGLFGAVEWTPRAAAMIEAKEYRYFSPVFSWDAETGDVLDLHQGALTNDPALDGLPAVTARAAARYQPSLTETNTMNPLLVAVLAALGLADTTTEAQAIAALSAIKNKPDPLAALRQSLGLADNADATVIATACSALKAKADKATPDPALFAPIAVVEELKTAIAALTTRVANDDVTQLVDAGLKDGRLLPAQKEWAQALGKSDVAALRSYLDKTPPIAALRGTQTEGVMPDGSPNEHRLTDAELAVCRALEIAPAEYAKQRTA
jgi:phage I-like protein